MSTNKYWQERLIREADARRLYEDVIELQMQSIYKEVSQSIQHNANAFLGRFADQKGVTINELQKAVDAVDIRSLQNKAAEYVRDRNLSKTANTEMKAYNLKMRLSRLEYLQAQIEMEVIKGASKEEAYTRSLLNQMAIDKFREQAGILGLSIPEPAVINSSIQALIKTPYMGKLWSDRLWRRQKQLTLHVNKFTKDLVLIGKNPKTAVANLKAAFDVTTYEATRLAVTEGARIQTAVTKINYENNGIEKYRFLAETTACPICADLNNQVFKVKDMLPGENAAPIHPHCHCTEIPEVED